MTVFPYFRYLLIILFSTYGVIYLLRFSLARPPPKEAVNNAKYIKGITQMAFLPEELKPSKAHDHGKRRLIFIGDVHGAYDELVSLLDKVKYKSSTDHVVFLGDLVSKGPHSQKVVKLAMKLNASCVIGNHDYELLDWMGYIDSVGDSRLDTYINPEDLPKELVLGAEEHVLAMGFDSQAAGWMLQCPLILNVGSVHGEDVVAVHAGLLPGRPFEEQDPWTIMNMRNIHKGEPSRDTDKGEPWAHLWTKAQRDVDNPITIIYGHDARRGLQIRKHTKGLDTNCVRGGRLTALIYPGEQIVSVKCKEYVS